MSNTVKPVKMADIARALNISTVAVSKALSGQKGVSEELREQVKALADEMGYKSPAAQRVQGVSRNIGVLIPQRYLDSNETFYWKLYQEVVSRAMQKECYAMLEVVSDDDARTRRFPRLVTENKAEALIILGKPPCHYAGEIRREWARPVVFLDFYDADVTADSVISDGFYGTYQMTKYLYGKGHRRIGFVGTLLATESITDRYLGYTKFLMEQGLPIRGDWRIDDRSALDGTTLDMTLPAEMPTAFVCNCDFMAARFIRLLRDKGYAVPEDISVVGFDNYLYPGLCDIGITTYAVDIREMARCAVRLLLKRLAGEQGAHGLEIVKGYPVEKDSVKAL